MNDIIIAPIKIDQESLTIKLPAHLSKYLKLNRRKDKEVFVSLTNGVIQLSSKEPIAAIPVLTEDNLLEFEEQP